VALGAEEAGKEFPFFCICICICSLTLFATAPLDGKFPFCESGFNTSHAVADGGNVEEGFEDAFSMLESWDQKLEVEVLLFLLRYLMMMILERRNKPVMIVLIRNTREYSISGRN